MQTFNKKKVALAVGAALLAAGAAQASAPALRATNPILAASVNAGAVDADVRALLSATGAVNKAITIDVALTQAPVSLAAVSTTNTSTSVTVTSTVGLVPGMVLTGNAGIPANATVASITNATTFVLSAAATATAAAGTATATAPAGPLAGGVATTAVGSVNSAAALVMGNATPANNSVIVWAGASNTAVVPSTGATAAVGQTAAGVAHVTISLPAPGASAAYRVNGATGALEYCANTAAATPVWNAVKVDIQQVAGKEIYTEVDGTGAYLAGTDQPLVASAGTAVGNSLAPTPIVSTTSAAGGTLVNGFKVDTAASITLANTNLAVKTRATNTAFPAAALPTAPTCVAATVSLNGSCTMTFLGLGTLASAADFAAPAGVDADDVAFYNTTNFNTGVVNGTVPWTVDGVNATQASYTNVFNTSDGVASKLGDTTATVGTAGVAAKFAANNVVDDGAQVVLVKAESSSSTGASNLSLTFSEPMTLLGADDVREVAENLLIGSDSLAALALNANSTLTIAAPATTAGQGVMTVAGAPGADLAGKNITVNSGIALKEQNDTGYSATVPALDNTAQADGQLSTGVAGSVQLAGGVAASNGQTAQLKAPSTATAMAITAAPISIAFGTDTTARAYTGTDATKVDRIVVAFAAGKEIALNASPAKTMADLAADMVVTVTGNSPVTSFQFHPTASQLAISGNGDTLTITLPTALIYSKINSIATMEVQYRNATNNTTNSSVLVNKNATATQAAGSVAVSTATDEPVVLPLSAMGVTNNMLTQSIVGTLTSATPVSGDLVEAYVAKWEDAPATAASTINAGTLGGLVAGKAFTFAAGSQLALEGKITTQRGNIKAAVAQVPGVNAAAAAVAAEAIPVYVVLTDVPLVADTSAAALTAYNTAVSAIDAVAKSAAKIGAHAIDGSDSAVAADNYKAVAGTATTSAAALSAGVAAALSEIVNSATIPQASKAAARNAAAASGATVPSVINAMYSVLPTLQVKQASLNAVTLELSGPVLGKLTVTETAGATGTRGLVFIDTNGGTSATAAGAGMWASGVVSGTSYNLLLGANPSATDILLKTNKNWFVLLQHKPSSAANSKDLTLITSADPLATNFVQFSPNLITGSGTRTTLSTDLSKIKKLAPVSGSTAWALYGLGNPAVNASAPAGHVPSFPRRFVGLKGTTVANTVPVSFWTSDAAGADVALTMKSGAVSVATEQGTNKATLSTISPASFVAGSQALAWQNDVGAAANDHIDTLQVATAPLAGSIRIGGGWSLVTVDSAMAAAVPAAVGAIIKVGAQVGSGYTWIKATDAAATPVPSLTAGEAVFVHSTLGGAIN